MRHPLLSPLAAAAVLLSLACGGIPAEPSSLQPAQGQAQVQVQGPVQWADGSLLWMDSQGRFTGVYPDTGMLYMGQGDQVCCARDPYGGWYGLQGGQLVPLAGMPPELMDWPGALGPLPGGYVLPAPQPRPQQAVASGYGGGGVDPYVVQSQINDMVHETNMAILKNMESDPVEYYSTDGEYLGTW